MMKYKKVAVGGTFDQLHRGHRALLSKAFKVGEKVVIGLTSDCFVEKMGKPHTTAPFDDRQKDLQTYLSLQGYAERAKIVPLDDAYGLTISDLDFDALVVSQETLKIAKTINRKRQKMNLIPLHIVEVKMVPAENKRPISSTRIRSGEIDRNGHLLQKTQ